MYSSVLIPYFLHVRDWILTCKTFLGLFHQSLRREKTVYASCVHDNTFIFCILQACYLCDIAFCGAFL